MDFKLEENENVQDVWRTDHNIIVVNKVIDLVK